MSAFSNVFESQVYSKNLELSSFYEASAPPRASPQRHTRKGASDPPEPSHQRTAAGPSSSEGAGSPSSQAHVKITPYIFTWVVVVAAVFHGLLTATFWEDSQRLQYGFMAVWSFLVLLQTVCFLASRFAVLAGAAIVFLNLIALSALPSATLGPTALFMAFASLLALYECRLLLLLEKNKFQVAVFFATIVVILTQIPIHVEENHQAKNGKHALELLTTLLLLAVAGVTLFHSSLEVTVLVERK